VRHYLKKGESEKDDEKKTAEAGDGKFAEFHSKRRFSMVTEALDMFKNDELLFTPGE